MTNAIRQQLALVAAELPLPGELASADPLQSAPPLTGRAENAA